MELTIGIVGDFWTPRAAEQALWVVTQMTPKKGEELFERVGNMGPSKSSLDRLPKLIDARWEEHRAEFEKRLREGLVISEHTVAVCVALDGVLAPVDGGEHTASELRAAATARDELSKGPAGYREVGCATLSFCDENGDMLGAIRFACAPEPRLGWCERSAAWGGRSCAKPEATRSSLSQAGTRSRCRSTRAGR